MCTIKYCKISDTTCSVEIVKKPEPILLRRLAEPILLRGNCLDDLKKIVFQMDISVFESVK